MEFVIQIRIVYLYISLLRQFVPSAFFLSTVAATTNVLLDRRAVLVNVVTAVSVPEWKGSDSESLSPRKEYNTARCSLVIHPSFYPGQFWQIEWRNLHSVFKFFWKLNRRTRLCQVISCLSDRIWPDEIYIMKKPLIQSAHDHRMFMIWIPRSPILNDSSFEGRQSSPSDALHCTFDIAEFSTTDMSEQQTILHAPTLQLLSL